MRLLDRYVLFVFLRVFLVALVSFGVLLVAIDFFGRLGYFLDADRVDGTFAEGYSTTRRVFLFYAVYVPFLLQQVLPFVTVSAGLFSVAHMLHGNEVAPVVAAGTSVRRLFLPLFAAGLLVSVGHVAFQQFLVPALSKEQMAIKRFFSADQTGVRDPPHIRDGRGTVTRASWYGFSDGALTSVVVQRPWQTGGFEIWKAPRLEPLGDHWRAPEGVEIQPPGVDSLPRRMPEGAEVDIGVAPDDVDALVTKRGIAGLSLSQLKGLVDRFPGRRHLRVALHKQVARPLASFAMLLLGVPLLLGAGRAYFAGGALAFALSMAYYFLDIFFTSLGDRGDLPPFLAAYSPLALLLSLGVARLSTVTT
ncbi:MAG TPA: LptF/LptG family permease [Planctomycetota bacterium]|nr:LptF/LptG family permease [Planctomycetota bacterium]